MLSKILSVILGLIFGGTLSLLFIAVHIKRTIDKKAEVDFSSDVGDKEREKVNKIIKTYERKIILSSVKVKKTVGYNYLDVIKETAKVFNPDSQRPMLELNEKQAFEFGQSVIGRLTKVFDVAEVPFIHDIKISSAIKYSSLIIKVVNNKKLKVATNVAQKIKMLLNALNPYFWVRDLCKKAVKNLTVRLLIKESVKIIAVEFANLYGRVNNENQSEKVNG